MIIVLQYTSRNIESCWYGYHKMKRYWCYWYTAQLYSHDVQVMFCVISRPSWGCTLCISISCFAKSQSCFACLLEGCTNSVECCSMIRPPPLSCEGVWLGCDLIPSPSYLGFSTEVFRLLVQDPIQIFARAHWW